MRRAELRRRLAWRELQLASVKRQTAALMPAANRTGRQTGLRREKRRENIVSLKIVACGFPAGFHFESCNAVVV
jgi:hypothetical protein